MSPLTQIGRALSISAAMTWEILWALILGFALSAVVRAFVRREDIARALGDDSPNTLGTATLLGVASSSCSYAAVALARSLFRKGASFTAAMVFEIASTNLVIELGIIIWLLLGWQFTLAEFVGGGVMIVIVAVLFRLFLRPRLVAVALAQADKGLAGSMEGHAAMDLSVGGEGPIWRRLFSPAGFTAASGSFVMEWAAVLRDIVIGLLIAGAVTAWVPMTFWPRFFFQGHGVWSAIWGPVIGPIVAMLSFVCSIGNVPLAAVLWNGGISFGGVTSFMYADLLILPILNIYRKYYGVKMTSFVLATFYAAMVLTGYVVEIVFGALGLVPAVRAATVAEASISWNYTTVLNVVFLALAAVLVWRFFSTGGMEMLRMMGGSPPDQTKQTG
ncbi:MAG TPA: permease [Coriobacteriia bacterium]